VASSNSSRCREHPGHRCVNHRLHLPKTNGYKSYHRRRLAKYRCPPISRRFQCLALTRSGAALESADDDRTQRQGSDLPGPYAVQSRSWCCRGCRAIVKTCGSSSLGGLSVDEGRVCADQGDEVGCVGIDRQRALSAICAFLAGSPLPSCRTPASDAAELARSPARIAAASAEPVPRAGSPDPRQAQAQIPLARADNLQEQPQPRHLRQPGQLFHNRVRHSRALRA
jgi:hypothetical protein